MTTRSAAARGPQVVGAPWARVIVVNYNGGALIQACADALAGQTMTDFEAVIVDNASTDGSADSLTLPDPRFVLIRNDSNVGFAAANNVGAHNCWCDWIATLNPDTIALSDWLLEMRRGTERHPDTAMFGTTLVSATEPSIADGFGDVLSITGMAWRGGQGRPVADLPNHDCEVLAPCAAAALYRRSAFEAAGGFDGRFFCYLEDVDLGLRMRLLGGRCIQLRRATVCHRGSAITGLLSPFTTYHSFRNRLFLIFKNLPTALLVLAIPLNLAVSLYVVLRQDEKDFSRSALRGLWHGVKGLKSMLRPRSHVQSTRCLSLMDVARLLSWHPRDLRNAPVRTWPL